MEKELSDPSPRARLITRPSGVWEKVEATEKQ